MSGWNTKEQRREYYQKNREKILQYDRDWRARQKGYVDYADMVEQRKKKQSILNPFREINQRPPWEIVGWTAGRYRRWLKKLQTINEF